MDKVKTCAKSGMLTDSHWGWGRAICWGGGVPTAGNYWSWHEHLWSACRGSEYGQVVCVTLSWNSTHPTRQILLFAHFWFCVFSRVNGSMRKFNNLPEIGQLENGAILKPKPTGLWARAPNTVVWVWRREFPAVAKHSLRSDALALPYQRPGVRGAVDLRNV